MASSARCSGATCAALTAILTVCVTNEVSHPQHTMGAAVVCAISCLLSTTSALLPWQLVPSRNPLLDIHFGKSEKGCWLLNRNLEHVAFYPDKSGREDADTATKLPDADSPNWLMPPSRIQKVNTISVNVDDVNLVDWLLEKFITNIKTMWNSVPMSSNLLEKVTDASEVVMLDVVDAFSTLETSNLTKTLK